MRTSSWKASSRVIGAVIAIAIALGTPVAAAAALLDATVQGAGNKGALFRPQDGSGNPANFVLTARSGVDEFAPTTANAPGPAGTVCIDATGAGVQSSAGTKSCGISGVGGTTRDEELIFTYDPGVLTPLDSIVLGLVDIDFGTGVGNQDDPVIFLYLDSAPTLGVVIEENVILAAFTPTGSLTGTVDFGLFASLTSLSVLSGNPAISAFKIRETNSHIYVNLLSDDGYTVGEPMTLALFGAGLAGLGWIRRRKPAA